MSGDTVIEYDTLEEFAVRLFMAAGSDESDARTIAHVMLEADLRGVRTHGLARFSTYVERIRAGSINMRPRIRSTKVAPSIALVDGDNGLGQLVGMRAMETAVALARENGTAVASVKGSNHLGALGVYTLCAIEHNMVGIVLQNSSPVMAAPGATAPIIGNNPMAIGVPTGDDSPFVLDMAFSTVARGKIILAAKSGEKIPFDWAINDAGEPTDDPQEALGGTLAPFGGTKGFNLGLVVEILAGVLSGAGLTHDIPGMVGPRADPTKPRNVGHFVMAIDIERFMPIEAFYARMSRIAHDVRSAPMRDSDNPLRYPGEGGAANRQRQVRDGIAVPRATLNELISLAQDYDLSVNFFQQQ